MQHTATHCNTLQHCRYKVSKVSLLLKHTATPHTATTHTATPHTATTRCNATRFNTLQHCGYFFSEVSSLLKHTATTDTATTHTAATHAATRCITLQHCRYFFWEVSTKLLKWLQSWYLRISTSFLPVPRPPLPCVWFFLESQLRGCLTWKQLKIILWWVL